MFEFKIDDLYLDKKEETEHYFNDAQRQSHLLKADSDTKLLMTAQGNIAHGKYMCVLKDGRTYISNDAKVHHSDFLAGENVHFAGELYIVKGKIVLITNSSGIINQTLSMLVKL